MFYPAHFTIECKKPFANISEVYLKRFLHCIRKPVSITQETPRGGGLDSFPKNIILTFTTPNLIADVKQQMV
jgi:hypothetical protein